MDNYKLLFDETRITPITFNNFIDKIYYINLSSRIDRNIHINKQLSKHNLIGHKFTAIEGTKGIKARIACKKSHLSVIRNAIKLSLSNVCILEDDTVFVDNFLEIANYCLNELPSDWDMLFLGHCFSSYNKPIGKYLFVPKQIYCTHCYCINKKAYNKIIQVLENNYYPIDHNYNYLNANKVINTYMCNPSIAYQIPNRSDIGEGPNNSNNLINND